MSEPISSSPPERQSVAEVVDLLRHTSSNDFEQTLAKRYSDVVGAQLSDLCEAVFHLDLERSLRLAAHIETAIWSKAGLVGLDMTGDTDLNIQLVKHRRRLKLSSTSVEKLLRCRKAANFAMLELIGGTPSDSVGYRASKLLPTIVRFASKDLLDRYVNRDRPASPEMTDPSSEKSLTGPSLFWQSLSGDVSKWWLQSAEEVEAIKRVLISNENNHDR